LIQALAKFALFVVIVLGALALVERNRRINP
jgi:hypothetical protein